MNTQELRKTLLRNELSKHNLILEEDRIIVEALEFQLENIEKELNYEYIDEDEKDYLNNKKKRVIKILEKMDNRVEIKEQLRK